MKLYNAVNAWEQCDATMEEVYYFLRDFLEEGNEIRTLVAWLPNIIEIDVYIIAPVSCHISYLI